jgi:cobalt-zinc-cadmium resistance protein CzcA
VLPRILELALKKPLFILLGLLVFVGAGVAAFETLPIEAFPDISDIQVNVVALDPGHAAEEVEKQVTLPLESALSGLPHAVRVFTHTQAGLTFLMVTYDDGITDKDARLTVAERLRDVDLPPGVQADIAPLSTAIGEILRFRLVGSGMETRELRTLQDWVVEKQLRQVPGVADIVTMGGSVKQYDVQPDLQRLRDAKLSLAQLFAALSRANANSGGGAVTQGRQEYLIRSLGAFRSSTDIGEVVVAEANGSAIRVRDVATVTTDHAPKQGLVGEDDDDDIVNGIVLLRKGENPSDVLAGVKARIAQLNERILPRGVRIVPYYDRSWLIDRTLHTVFGNLLEGAALVILVLYAFLFDLRAAVIVALTIPLALLAAFIGLRLIGIPANLLSLGAMDFGIIVDGAVIVAENILRRLHALPESERASRAARRTAVFEAAKEVGRPTVFSMLIIVAAHLPIFSLQRHEGRIFAPMAWTVVFALVGALIVSVTLVPLLANAWLDPARPHRTPKFLSWITQHYRSALEWVLARERLVVGCALAALIASLGVAASLGSEFLPELNEGTIWVNASYPPGLSPDEAMAEARRMRQQLRSVPEVRTVVSKIGRPDDGTDPKLFNSGEFFIDFKPEKEWRAGKNKDDLIDDMDRALQALPGIETSFSQPIRDNVLESISQVDGQVVIKIHGEDLDVLRHDAIAVLNAIKPVPGVERAFIDREGSLPQLLIDIDRERAGHYGVNIGDIQDLIETALAGKVTSELWEGERHFSVVVRLNRDERSPEKLMQLPVATPDGAQVPLSAFATFRMQSGQMNIAREDGRRVVPIGIFIRGRDLGSTVKEMQQRVQAAVALPRGYDITWSGEFENQQRAMKRLALVVPLSVLLIFLLLFDAFGSVWNAGLILANVPFALVGGILALAVTGIPLSVSAAIGFIALFGQAVLNGVVMLSHFENLRAQGVALEEAVRRGALDRLRTVLMTALLAMLGLLPMALSHGIGSETQRPLAVVVIGGLLSATALTLFVLPTLYRRVALWQAARAARAPKVASLPPVEATARASE